MAIIVSGAGAVSILPFSGPAGLSIPGPTGADSTVPGPQGFPGQDGRDGTSLIPTGNFATLANLPTTSDRGDTFIATADDTANPPRFAKYDALAWVGNGQGIGPNNGYQNLGPFRGPPGPTTIEGLEDATPAFKALNVANPAAPGNAVGDAIATKTARAANNAALAALPATSGRALREGFAAVGDGGAGPYAYAATAATAEDGGSVVAANASGFWLLDPSAPISPRLWGAKFDGTTDDSEALRKALVYAGSSTSLSRSVVIDGSQMLCASATRIVIPPNVHLHGVNTYEGADGALVSSLPTIQFSANAGGLFTSAGSSISGLQLFGSTGGSLADHVLEFGGQVGLTNVRIYAGRAGGLMTRNIVAGRSFANFGFPYPIVSGLANGTYSNVVFTGGGGSGARMNVTVASGAITSVSFSANGVNYAPYFLYGFAAGALYSGSPVIALAGSATTAGMGRSKFRNVFIIAGATTEVGLEVDGCFDYTDIDSFQWFSPVGINGISTALKLGRIDGLNILNPKFFGANTAINLNQPSNDPSQPFANISGIGIDGVNVGIVSTAPIKQLSITGGHARTIGRSIAINNSATEVAITGINCVSQADVSIALVDYDKASVTGSTFATDTINQPGFATIAIGAGSGTHLGTGRYIISGNVTDGRRPFIVVDGTVPGGYVGPNAWPGRNGYPATSGGSPTFGYFYTQNATANRAASVASGQEAVTSSATGFATINHPLGSIPQLPKVAVVGDFPGKAIVSARTSETITIRFYDGAGAVVPNTPFTVDWEV